MALTITLLKTGNLGSSNSGSVDLIAAWLVTDIPAAPSGLHAMTVSPTQVDLTWDDSSNNEDGFKIDYSTNNFSTVETVVAGADTGSKWITGLQSNMPYEFRVRAVNAYGESTNATFVTAQTAAQVNPGDSNYITVDTVTYGFTDTAIRNAIAASQHDGDTIYIPPGNYTFTGPSPSSIALKGGGRVYRGATVLTTGTDGTTAANDDPSNQHGTVIESPAGQAAFTFDGTDPTANGMYNVRITGLTFAGWGLDLQKDGASPPAAVNYIVVDNCHFDVTHDRGITNSTGIRNTVIANNLFDLPQGPGIFFYGQSSDNISWDHVIIANNQLQNGPSTGMHWNSDGQNSTHLLIEQNYTTQLGGLAFEIQGRGTYTTVQDNYYYYDDPYDSASTLAFSIPVQDVTHPTTRRNYAWAKLSQTGPDNGVRCMYELGGYNVNMYDNYSRGGYRSITTDGSNASGVVHDNQISQYIIAPYSDNGAHELRIDNGAGVPLTWDLKRPKPGPDRRVDGLILNGGLLTVDGTKLQDSVTIEKRAIDSVNYVAITVNGEPFVFPASAITDFAFSKHLASLSIGSGASVRIKSHATPNDPAGTIVTQALSIVDSGTYSAGVLDLTNNSMIIDYSGSVDTLVGDTRVMLQDGRLNTDLAGAAYHVGYGDNAVLGRSTFAGVDIDSSSLLIKFTYAGDANLDGQVDVTDLGAVATNWQTAAPWTGGDFNYDNFVDVTDLGMLATNWQAGVGNPLGPQQQGGDSDFWAIVDTLHLTRRQRGAIAAVLGTHPGGPTL
jgi:hypothetical protein